MTGNVIRFFIAALLIPAYAFTESAVLHAQNNAKLLKVNSLDGEDFMGTVTFNHSRQVKFGKAKRGIWGYYSYPIKKIDKKRFGACRDKTLFISIDRNTLSTLRHIHEPIGNVYDVTEVDSMTLVITAFENRSVMLSRIISVAGNPYCLSLKLVEDDGYSDNARLEENKQLLIDLMDNISLEIRSHGKR